MEAKTKQGWLESRIDYLENILAEVEIIEDGGEEYPSDMVHLNRIVRVQQDGYEP